MEDKNNITGNESKLKEQIKPGEQENQLEETELDEISGGGYGIGGKTQTQAGNTQSGGSLSVNKQGYAIGG